MPNQNTEAKISARLLELGFSPALKGYHYTLTALRLIAEKPERAYNGRIVKELYVEVAEKHKTTPAGVERCIRHALEVRADHPTELWQEYAKNYWPNREVPTNSHFLAVVGELFRLKAVG